MSHSMIDAATGELALASGDRTGPSLTLQAFRASPLAANAQASPGGGAWMQYHLGRQVIAGAIFSLVLYFDGSRLAMVRMSLVEPDESPSWDDWSDQKELARKAKHDAWLTTQLGPPPWVYPWGRIESNYDPRSGASLVVVVYG
jgi:hypothetical protein